MLITHGNQVITTSISHFLACKSSNSLIVNCMKMWNKSLRTEQRIKPFNRLLYKYLLDTYEI